MKPLYIAPLIAAVSFHSIAQTAAPSSTQPSEENATWLRERALQQIAESKASKQPGDEPAYLQIIALADYPAPTAVKQGIADGIRARAQGILESPAGSIPATATILSNVNPDLTDIAVLSRRLSYTPTDLTKTDLKNAQWVGSNPTGSITAGHSTGMARTFRVPAKGVVIFSEDDYLASRTRLTLIHETLNATVNGTPARAYAATSKDGRGKAEVRWVTPTRSYWLTLISDDSAGMEDAEAYLLQIARQIDR